jgi:ubiquinone/menaquinone biosynthesis C-methylase UbiE
MEKFSLEKAQDKASKMQNMIKAGEVNNYSEAGQKIDSDKEVPKEDYFKRFKVLGNRDYELRYLAMDYAKEFQQTVRTALKNLAAELPEAKELKVLEAGSGTGLTTIEILEADPRIKVIACDNEPKMMDQAKLVLADLNERIDFKEGDILSTLKNIESESLDAFASALTVHNFLTDYRMEVFQEITRVLKKGGLFVNADKYAFDDLDKHLNSLKDQIKSFDIFDRPDINRPDVKEGWTNHYHQDELTKITEGEQVKILESLGYEDIKVTFRQSMEATIVARKK